MGAKKEFPCIGCGICCTKVGEHFKNYDVYPKYLQKTLDDFPYQVSEDGTCDQLTDKGLCGVYKDRPLACNMEKLYDERDWPGERAFLLQPYSRLFDVDGR